MLKWAIQLLLFVHNGHPFYDMGTSHIQIHCSIFKCGLLSVVYDIMISLAISGKILSYEARPERISGIFDVKFLLEGVNSYVIFKSNKG